jgi:hypothetical protein
VLAALATEAMDQTAAPAVVPVDSPDQVQTPGEPEVREIMEEAEIRETLTSREEGAERPPREGTARAASLGMAARERSTLSRVLR